MATLVRSSLNNQIILYVKGAPEIVLSKCKQVLTSQGIVSGTAFRPDIEKQLLDYQNQAMRTLGFAYKFWKIINMTR